MTAQPPDRRQVARLTVPRHLAGGGSALRLVQLLELSSEGVRIEHRKPLPAGVVCQVDLPPALGQGRLTGRVVWSRLHRGEQTREGDTRVYYQSGLTFIAITPEQQGALAVALRILRTGAVRLTHRNGQEEGAP